jgi:phage terminase large subunit
MDGFEVQEKAIYSDSGGEIKYRGLSRNPGSIKSAHGFGVFCCEESDNLSDRSIKTLTPTARNKAMFGTPEMIMKAVEEKGEAFSGVQMFFIANPKSANDPFSKRFINPYLDTLRKDGIYEDDLHTIIMINYWDNPWFAMSGLEGERQHDLANLSTAMYEHIWEGGFMDEVENSIISQEWFNACIDADIKKNFKPKGAIVVSLDPSDEGADAKGITVSQGSVILECLEITTGDAFDCVKTAADLARQWKADHFIWDCDGMGATLRNEVTQQLAGMKIQVHMYRGSAGVFAPDSMYAWDNKGLPIRNPSSNKDTFKNRRSQRTWGIRDRIYFTWRAVQFGEYIDPDKLISFRSTIKALGVLRSEACKIPLKQGGQKGMIQIMSKAEMRKEGIKSPNLFDSVVMTDDIPPIRSVNTAQSAPQPIKRFNQ